MITASVEPLFDCLDEMKTMFPAHAAELDTYADRRPLDPDYAEYKRRDDAGGILCVVVRQDAKLIGYFVGLLGPQLHYRTTFGCLGDIFYTAKETRGHVASAAVIAMFRCVIAECKRRGVKVLRAGHKLGDHDAEKLFKAFKFEPVEMVHSLWLGDDDA